MNGNKLIEIIIQSGYRVEEYENHYSVSGQELVSVVVTVPKATYIVKTVVDGIKKLLHL